MDKFFPCKACVRVCGGCCSGVCILLVTYWENSVIQESKTATDSKRNAKEHLRVFQKNKVLSHESNLSLSAGIYQIALKESRVWRNCWKICRVTNPKLDPSEANWRDPLGRRGCPFPQNYRPGRCPWSLCMCHWKSSPSGIELSGNVAINKRHSIFHLLIVL